MIHLCYTFNTSVRFPECVSIILKTIADIKSAIKKMKFEKWPTGGYVLEAKPPRVTPLSSFKQSEYVDELKRLVDYYRRVAGRQVYLCYAMNYDAITAPVDGVKTPAFVKVYPDTGKEIEFPSFSIIDEEKTAGGSYLFELFDSVGVYTPEHHYETSDFNDPIDPHFRDLTQWVKRAADLEKIIMITTTQIKPLADRTSGKLAMVYMLIDRYNRRYLIRMPTTPVTKRDLPRLAKEFNLPDLEIEVKRAALPHLMLPWGYWYNETDLE